MEKITILYCLAAATYAGWTLFGGGRETFNTTIDTAATKVLQHYPGPKDDGVVRGAIAVAKVLTLTYNSAIWPVSIIRYDLKTRSAADNDNTTPPSR